MSAPKWMVQLLLVIFIALLSSSLVASHTIHNESPHRKLASPADSGYISIDCGINEAYTDNESNIWYQPDSNFIETGQNHILPSQYTFDQHHISKQLNTLRSFPDGDRNCYTLITPKQGRSNKYLIRAFFAYRNYDLKNTTPAFDVYLGVNHWKTIEFEDVLSYFLIDVVYVAVTDTISVCLVNIGKGVPFISSLELWFLSDSTYSISSLLPQDVMTRSNLGMSQDTVFIRYKDDTYGRLWFNRFIGNSKTINTSSAIDANGIQNTYKLPSQVLKTAIQSLSLNSSLEIYFDKNTDKSYEYYVYLYFFEFEEQARTQKRIMDITFNDVTILTQLFTPQYMKVVTIVRNITKVDQLRILIKSTPESDLPAMINAFEVYRVLHQPNSPTYQEDVDAIWSIKRVYEIPRINWQGDPCIPTNFTWEGLTCSSDSNPRIISLNLSARRLTGEIDASFSGLTKLESLDLSNNKLTGKIPEFFSELPSLKFLNLSGNQLTGSIPKSLKQKLNTTLLLSLEGNPGLCLTGSCEKKKSLVPIIASIAASIVVLVTIVVIYVMVRRIKRKKQGVSKKDGQKKSKNQVFSYSQVTRITSNFKTVIGKGGFGEVYLGTLRDGREVAVKLLSQTSNQGYKEFHSEADLLTIVHHRNLVSLVGYCDEGDVKALIYEYMTKGNLQQLLSDKSPNVLKWSERLQIAVDAAHGLDYLHNGCKPPIVHRDLKTANILLNGNMQAKISDFGLSRAFANENDTHVSTVPAGTLGYLDPEFYSSGNLNKKSDVYSFGIILLELITGQPAIKAASPGSVTHILQWVNPKLGNGDIKSIVDPRLKAQYNTSSAWKLLEIAMSCIPPTAIQRPDMSRVVNELKDCLALEISIERTESSRRKSSNSLDMSSLNSFQIESVIRGPYAR
ncbi:putative LRR receptor-like serine/threonine-protein kinase [Senna tora]|uniref:non-specific serine/threonine protein kinase n=1 Tax=Senna tora TaxID=362788 RepID=A0A834T255_9FABA|nr:putative LRR receptor-like serine/threonine-protein kinase [Senna tora]